MLQIEDIVKNPADLKRTSGFYRLMPNDFEQYLEGYLRTFEATRELFSKEQWLALPFGQKSSEWQWRCESLEIVGKVIREKTPRTVLEIGAWNGWLTKHLAKHAEIVVAADYFSAPFDGLATIGQLAPNIIPLQCRLATISSDLAPVFDMIVLNHCLAYTADPATFINGLKKLLRPGGTILSVGNAIFRNASAKIKSNERAVENYRALTGKDLYILPVKGYLDSADRAKLIENGFEVTPCRAKRIQNIYASMIATAPRYVSVSYNLKPI